MVSYGEDEFGAAGRLRLLNLNVVSNEVCKESNRHLNRLVKETHFCAGNRDGSGPCTGDSGAGLLHTDTGEKYFLTGILNLALQDPENGG